MGKKILTASMTAFLLMLSLTACSDSDKKDCCDSGANNSDCCKSNSSEIPDCCGGE